MQRKTRGSYRNRACTHMTSLRERPRWPPRGHIISRWAMRVAPNSRSKRGTYKIRTDCLQPLQVRQPTKTWGNPIGTLSRLAIIRELLSSSQWQCSSKEEVRKQLTLAKQLKNARSRRKVPFVSSRIYALVTSRWAHPKTHQSQAQLPSTELHPTVP